MLNSTHESTHVGSPQEGPPADPGHPRGTVPERISFTDDLVGMSPTRLGDVLAAASHVATDYLTEEHGPCSATPVGQLEAAVRNIDLANPLGSFRASIAELRTLWLDHAVWYHHPRYIAHLNCPISSTAVAGETIASAVNTAVESWDQASSAALIEQKIVHWLCESLRWQVTGIHGVFTSGGTQSNLQALLTARNKALAAHGYDTLSRLCILHTADTHYSVARAANILGLHPTTGSRVVGTDTHHRMSPAALEEAIAECSRDGLVPMAVVATAGTTDLGAIDPLDDLASITRKHSLHLHVDAAYGGAMLVSPTQRHRLKGIESADSITVDFHKTYFQPVACSAMLLRTPEDFRHISWHADYLNPQGSGELNLADFSLQTTRRFDALKLWLTLRTHGAEAIGTAFDTCCKITRDSAALIENNPHLELLEHPQLTTLVFRPTHPDAPSPQHIKRVLHNRGEAVIATTVIDGDSWLKFTILDPTLSTNDIQLILDLIVGCATSAAANPTAGTPAVDNSTMEAPTHA
ncbi:pyridoxal phosphate-dependent decarboxylase family protein [Corynebacterium auriscanis]|uniref:pyridoxal phosphate-dependent decarboxylase family protein n=1 Tax=Corynebacterium auriscanis TaxID=99807 RepID=UPI0025B2D6E6|nr:pyridoxal-dependent decarboxylase [Corynebacterium auriscanis]WJY73549.1 L-2,4-diaminobutyrate decarboxylase [Corynebacterium auriscanis]